MLTVPDGEVLAQLDVPVAQSPSVSWSPDAKLLAVCKGPVVRLWDPEHDQLAGDLVGHVQRVLRADFSPDGHWLATASNDRTFRLWDLSRRDRPSTIPIAKSMIRTIAFHADGRRVACAIQDGTIGIWDVVERSRLASVSGSDALVGVAWSPDGLRLASCGMAGGLWVRDARSLDLLQTIDSRVLGRAEWIGFDPTGERIAIAGRDGSVRLLDWRSGEFHWRHRLHRIATEASFSPDGKLLASSGTDRSVRLLDVESGDLLSTWRGEDTYAGLLAFSPDGFFLATSGWNASESSLGTQLRDVRTGKVLWTIPVSAGRLGFAPDGTRLFLLEGDGTLEVYEPATGERIVDLTPPRGSNASSSLDVSPDGGIVVTGTTDGRLVVWDAHSWR